MVENKVRQIERDEIILCEECNNAIPKEFLEKNVGGIKNLYCQYCGVSLNLNYIPKIKNESSESPNITIHTQEESNQVNIQQDSQESNFALSYSNIRNALRDYIYQLIYQLLKSTPLTLNKIQNKKELKSSHINIVLKKIWKELKDLNPNDLTTQKLVSPKRRVKNYFEEFNQRYNPTKIFGKRILLFLQKTLNLFSG